LPFCNGIDYLDYESIKFGNIASLDIEVADREGWYTNLFELSLTNTGGIEPKYKKEFQAKVIASFKDNFICEFSAEIRISGDKKDHINSDLMASLDVKLLSGNIFGITKFKLFLPGTRNYDNEIVVTTLLEESGFLSPRSFYVNVGMLNWSNQFSVNSFIFQEKQSKEMIEYNYFREGPLIETNESFYWKFMGVESKNPNKTNPLFISRVVNKYWSKKNINSSKITVEALEKYNQAIFNSYHPSRQINYSYLGKDQNLFYKFDAANFALLNDHGITTHQRKFFFDKINNQFHPIYYDGNSNFLELGHIRWRQDYLEYQKLHEAAELLLRELNIDNESFNEKLNNRGIKITKEESTKVIAKYINNLTYIAGLSSNVLPTYLDFNSNNASIYYPEDFNYLFYNFENNNFELCDPKLIDCFISENSIDVEEVFSKKVEVEGVKAFLLGESREVFLESQSKKENKLEIEQDLYLRLYGEPVIQIDNEAKEIIAKLISKKDRVIIEGTAKFKDWKIILKTNVTLENSGLTYDENLLTGCLTINNLQIEDIVLEANNMFCEDSINILKSQGTIKNINIKNSAFDGLDLDYSEIQIGNLIITNANNDCLDVSSGSYIFETLDLALCQDKGLSVGEKSTVAIETISIINTKIGIAVKDSSKVNINSFISEKTQFCLQQYRKKQEYGPTFTKILDYRCDSQTLVQDGSIFQND